MNRENVLLKENSAVESDDLELLKTENMKLKKEVEQYKAEYFSISKRYEELTVQYNHVQAMYDAISNAACWKITKPVRVCLDGVKKILKSNRYTHLFCKGLKSIKQNGIQTTWEKVKRYFHRTEQLYTKIQSENLNVPTPKNFDEFISVFQKTYKHGENNIYLPDVLCTYDDAPDKKVILLVSHEASLTGAPIALYRLAQELKNQGHLPVFFTPRHGELIEELCKDNIPVIVYKDSRELDCVLLYKPIAEWLVQKRDLFDAVFVNTIIPSYVVSTFNNTEIPVIWWIHESRLSYSETYKQIMPETLGRNVSVYTAGPYAKQVLAEIRPAYQSDILLYSVPDFPKTNTDSYQLPQHAKGKMIFACVGTLEERKGHAVLANAITMLPESILEKCFFIFVGKKCTPEVEKTLLNLVEKYPKNAQYIGELTQSKLHAMYREITCLICSSSDDPMPIVVTEAFCSEKIVICSEHTGSAGIIQEKDAGLVYYNNSPRMLAEKIEHVAEHITELDWMRKNARSAYETYFTNHALNANIQKILDRTEDNQRIKETVSIVIPTYNAGVEFETLLKTVSEQKMLNRIEIVIVDSGSTDKTVEIAKKYDANVVQIPNEEFSHSYARNLGAQHATGDILLFMTQDTLPSSKKWVRKMIEPIVYENIGAVSCREECPDETELYYKVSSHIHNKFMGIATENKIGSIEHCTDDITLRQNAGLNDIACAIRKTVFMEFGHRFNYAEDLDLGIRLLKKGYQIKFLSDNPVIHGHNRPAEYYLKRSIVETIALDKIFGNHVDNNKSECEFINLAAAYSVVHSVKDTMKDNNSKNMDEFFDSLAKAFAVGLKRTPAQCLEYVKELKPTDKAGNIVYEIALQCKEPKETPALYVEARHVEYFVLQHVREYLDANEIVFTDAIKQQVIETMDKQLAVFIGTQIVYIHETSNLASMVKELGRGV